MTAAEGTGGFWTAHKLLCCWQDPNFLLIFVGLQYQTGMCAILKQCLAFPMPTSALLPTRGNTATVFQAGTFGLIGPGLTPSNSNPTKGVRVDPVEFAWESRLFCVSVLFR